MSDHAQDDAVEIGDLAVLALRLRLEIREYFARSYACTLLDRDRQRLIQRIFNRYKENSCSMEQAAKIDALLRRYEEETSMFEATVLRNMLPGLLVACDSEAVIL